MENNSKEIILAELYIKFEWTLVYKIFTAIWLGIEFCAFLDNSRFHSDYNYYYYIWEIPFYDLDIYGDGLSILNLLLGITITIIIAAIPFIMKSVYNFFVMKNKLTLTEDQLSGIIKKPFSKKIIQIPIEKIDKIFITNEFQDKFRSGKTLVIYYDSCVTKFHYAHNAEDFIDKVLKTIKIPVKK